MIQDERDGRRKEGESRSFGFAPYDIGENLAMSFVNVFDAGAENLLRMTASPGLAVWNSSRFGRKGPMKCEGGSDMPLTPRRAAPISWLPIHRLHAA